MDEEDQNYDDKIFYKLSEAWKKQQYLIESNADSLRVDDKVSKIKINGKACDLPNWVVFSPLIMACEKDISKEEQEIAKLQIDILECIQKKRSFDDPETEEIESERIKSEINKLKMQYSMLQSELSNESDDAQLNAQLSTIYDTELKKFQRARDVLQHNVNQLLQTQADAQRVYDTCIKDTEEMKQTIIDDVEESKSISQQINQLQKEFNEQQAETQKHLDRQKELRAMVFNLESTQAPRDHRAARADEAFKRNAEITEALNRTEMALKENAEKQDEIVMKMIESVSLSEMAAAEALKYQTRIDGYIGDLKHIEDVIAETKSILDDKVIEIEKQAVIHYSPIEAEMRKRLEEMRQQNTQLEHEKKFVNQQLRIAQENLILIKQSQCSVDADEMAETVFTVKENIDRYYEEMEHTMGKIRKQQQRISQMQPKIDASTAMAKDEVGILEKHRQQLEIGVRSEMVALNDVRRYNTEMEDANSKLKSILNMVKNDIKQRITEQVGIKDKELSEARKKFEMGLRKSQQMIRAKETELAEAQSDETMSQEEFDKTKLKWKNLIAEKDNDIEISSNLVKKLIEAAKSIKKAHEESNEELSQLDIKEKELIERLRKSERKQQRCKEVLANFEAIKMSLESEETRNKREIAKIEKQIKKKQKYIDSFSKPNVV